MDKHYDDSAAPEPGPSINLMEMDAQFNRCWEYEVTMAKIRREPDPKPTLAFVKRKLRVTPLNWYPFLGLETPRTCRYL